MAEAGGVDVALLAKVIEEEGGDLIFKFLANGGCATSSRLDDDVDTAVSPVELLDMTEARLGLRWVEVEAGCLESVDGLVHGLVALGARNLNADQVSLDVQLAEVQTGQDLHC